MSGQCVCPAGFKGQHCEKVCEKNKFGIGCAYSCDCDPLHSEGCDHITGKCLCRQGWEGEQSSHHTRPDFSLIKTVLQESGVTQFVPRVVTARAVIPSVIVSTAPVIPSLASVSAPGDLLELNVTSPALQDSTVLTASRLVRLVIPVSFITPCQSEICGCKMACL